MTTAPLATAHRAAVLGSPIAHSLSPVLHRAAYQRLGLTGRSYDAFDVTEAALPGFLDGLDAAQWSGLSLTMPLKRAVIPLLDAVSDTALAVEAVNTVLFAQDGTRHGDNTDVPGLIAALTERGITGSDTAAVLGGGATAASTLAALSSIVKGGGVDIYLRSLSRADELLRVAERVDIELRVHGWAQADAALASPLVVNTTPAGAADELAASVTEPVGTYFDVIYHPWPTRLAAAWQHAGGTVLGGLDLLIHQAALQLEMMTGIGAEQRDTVVQAMREAGLAALSAR
jgi:shikimate dehydrogenase